MDCTEARRLINQGVVPKSQPPLSAQLGFHLSTCTECQAYFTKQQDLLSTLLLDDDTFEPHPTPYAQSFSAEHTATNAPTNDNGTFPEMVRHADTNKDNEDAEDDDSLLQRALLPWMSFRERIAVVDTGRWLWVLSIALLIIIPLAGILWLAGILVRAHDNVSAMIVPTPAIPSTPVLAPNTVAHVSSSPTPQAMPMTATVQHARAVLSPLQGSTHGGQRDATTVASERGTATHDPENALEDGENGAAEQTPMQAQETKPERPAFVTLPEIESLPLVSLDDPTPWPTIESILPTEKPSAPNPQPQHVPPAPVAMDIPPPGSAINVLLLGNDRRPGEDGIPRTDAIMVILADPQQQRIAMLSLPRDLWVDIPSYGASRINAAYVLGEQYNAPGGGLWVARDTVSNLLGIPIHYVVMVDFEGFISLVDVLGGINVYVEKELYDTTFPTMDYGYTTVHFLPGMQFMDGYTALTYSRIRHPDSDFMRTSRQQAVIVGIASRLRERGDLKNITSVDSITGALKGYVQTDMPVDRIVGLVWSLRMVEAAHVEHYGINSSMVSWGVGADSYALSASRATLDALTGQLLGVGVE